MPVVPRDGPPDSPIDGRRKRLHNSLFDGSSDGSFDGSSDGRTSANGCGSVAAPDLTWLVDDRDGVVRLRLAGVLDLATELCLPLAADEALAHPAPALVLDLSGVEFCDARGLSALLLFRRQVQDAGAAVTFVGARPLVRRVFELVGQGSLITPPPEPA